MSFSNQNIVPKDCNYNCGTRMYRNTAENAYFEVFNKQKHICKNNLSINPQVIYHRVTLTLIDHFIAKNPCPRNQKHLIR